MASKKDKKSADPTVVPVEPTEANELAAESTDEDEGEDDGAEVGAPVVDSIDPDEALAEFAGYDSLEEESVGDDLDEDETSDAEGLAVAAADGTEDSEAAIPPKERRLAHMRLEARIEAVIFASQKPMRAQEITDLLADPGLTLADVERSLADLMDFYSDRSGGFRLHYLKRLGYQFQTSDAAGPLMERMFATRPRPISRAALETLAIIAYRQPVTRAEVEFIRGVDAGSIFKTLLERGLVRCVGRKEVVGRPMIFGTTDDFLKVFNLSSIKDLPSLESFQPARDVVQGAMARINENDELVDVEQYIADNTRDDALGDVEGESAAEEAGATPLADSLDVMEASSETSEAPRLIGATVAGSWDGERDGSDADSEVAVPARDRVPEGSGDLDR